MALATFQSQCLASATMHQVMPAIGSKIISSKAYRPTEPATPTKKIIEQPSSPRSKPPMANQLLKPSPDAHLPKVRFLRNLAVAFLRRPALCLPSGLETWPA